MISSHFQRQVEKLRSLSVRFAEVEAGAKGGLRQTSMVIW
jgi:hypothetical protein